MLYMTNSRNSELNCKAFVKAWKEMCGATQHAAELLIPKNKIFMLQPLSLKGPCNSPTIKVMVNHRKSIIYGIFCTYIYRIIMNIYVIIQITYFVLIKCLNNAA